MCRARAFNEALKVVDAGKKMEAVQTLRFHREMEREKSLKLSWKVLTIVLCTVVVCRIVIF